MCLYKNISKIMVSSQRRCSDFKEPTLSCYTHSQLIKIARKWNKLNPKSIIKAISDLSKEDLWIKLKKKFDNLDEEYWSSIIQDIDLNEQFVPEMPREWFNEPYSWLSDDDINRVMKAFKKAFPGFYFIESTPIDFDERDENGECKVSNLCKLKYIDLVKKCTSFGVVFNTDPSYKPGQHWIAIFVNVEEGKFFFFDSTGTPPPNEINILLNRLGMEAKEYFEKEKRGKKAEICINAKIHQLENTECGVYCLYFIYFMLSDGRPEEFNAKRIPDSKMKKLRGFFFDDKNGIYF